MNRRLYTMYWNYYLSLEKMLSNTNQYVTHSKSNEYVYSDEFSSIILLACSEIDSLLKILCDYYNIEKRGKYHNMNDYSKFIVKYIDTEMTVSTDNKTIVDESIDISPYLDIDPFKPYANLRWWADYQSIKHHRIENVKKGHLKNAITSVGAFYYLLRHSVTLLSKSEGKEYVSEKSYSNFWIPWV